MAYQGMEPVLNHVREEADRILRENSETDSADLISCLIQKASPQVLRSVEDRLGLYRQRLG